MSTNTRSAQVGCASCADRANRTGVSAGQSVVRTGAHRWAVRNLCAARLPPGQNPRSKAVRPVRTAIHLCVRGGSKYYSPRTADEQRNEKPRSKSEGGTMPRPKFVAPDELVQAYRSGISVEALARASGRSFGQIRRGLLNAGVRMRSCPPGRGEACPEWTGDAVGYEGAHFRLYNARGKASGHTCSCGLPAQWWVYDHADPDERAQDTGRLAGLPYSLDPEHYVAMCVRCHHALLWGAA